MQAKFFRVLKLLGSGYKARTEAEGKILKLKVGYPYEVEVQVPPAVRVFCFKPDIICCAGIDQQRTYQFAAVLRKIRPHTPFALNELRGMKYKDEVFNLKPVKKDKVKH